MRQDQGAGAKFQGSLHHLAGIDRGLVHGAALLYLVGDQAVLAVQEQHAELLGRGAGHAGLTVVQQCLP